MSGSIVAVALEGSDDPYTVNPLCPEFMAWCSIRIFGNFVSRPTGVTAMLETTGRLQLYFHCSYMRIIP